MTASSLKTGDMMAICLGGCGVAKRCELSDICIDAGYLGCSSGFPEAHLVYDRPVQPVSLEHFVQNVTHSRRNSGSDVVHLSSTSSAGYELQKFACTADVQVIAATGEVADTDSGCASGPYLPH